MFERAASAADHVVPTCVGEAGSSDSADAAEPDHGDRLAIVHCHAAMVDEIVDKVK
jgi:hypothetical protein